MKLTRLAAVTGLVVAAGVTGVALAAPAMAYPAGTTATATINSTTIPAGGAATVTVKNATPGGVLSETVCGVVIASGVTVPSSGSATISGRIPAGCTGNQTVRVTSTAGESFSFSVLVTTSSGGGGGTSSGGSSTTTNSGSSGGSGNLASTGAAVTGIGILGAALVAGGVFFVVAGRKRGSSPSA